MTNIAEKQLIERLKFKKILLMLTNFKHIVGVFYLFTAISIAQTGLNEGIEMLNSGKIDKAQQFFEKYDTNKEAIEYLGDIASFKKDWDSAIGYYENLVDSDPKNAMYNFKLGGAIGMKAYYGSKFQAAMLVGDIKEYLNKAAELDSQHIESRRALVEFYMQIPSFIGGSKTIAESYASDLDRLNAVDAYLADAYIYKIQDYQDLAKNKYNDALRAAIRNPELIQRNYLRYELGEASALYDIQPETGKKLLQDYIKNYGYKDLKSPAWAYLRLAQLERLQKNKDAALSLIKKSLEIDPSFDKALIEKQKIQRL